MVRCGLPLSLNALMMNMREPVHICKPLRETIGVEMTTTKLTNLYTLISNLLDKNMQIMIPFKHQPHLRSNTNSINSKNMNEILSKHCRFSNPRLRSAFVTENQMIIEDMQPRQEFHIEVPEIHLIDIFSCPTCTGQFSLEAYEKHVGLGPFAPGHNLFYSTDNELFFLVTMAAFSFSGENVPCNFCPASYSLKYNDPDMHKHALQHAKYILEPDDNLPTAKKKLFKLLINKKLNQTAACLPCKRIFPNHRLLFLHLWLETHKEDKHYCLAKECRKCMQTDMATHLIEKHPLEAKCPYACSTPGNELIHHINADHPQANQIIPVPEMKIIKDKKLPHWDKSIEGKFGKTKMDRKLEQEVNTRCKNPQTDLNIAGSFENFDPQGWIITKHIINCKIEKRNISRYNVPHIKENPCRFVSKILLLDRQTYSEAKREENFLLAFTTFKEKQKNMAILNELEDMYTKERLDLYDFILIGNCHFKTLESTEDMKIFNLSTEKNAVWNFDSLGTNCENMNFQYNEFIQIQTRKIHSSCQLTIYLESSLQPYLEHIPDTQRASFLEKNIDQLATYLLKIAVNLQERFVNVVVTTAIHSTYSKYYECELKHIQKYNMYLKIMALQLNLGILELDALGFYSHEFNNKTIIYRTDSRLTGPIADDQSNLLESTKYNIISLMQIFERHKEMLSCQLPVTT